MRALVFLIKKNVYAIKTQANLYELTEAGCYFLISLHSQCALEYIRVLALLQAPLSVHNSHNTGLTLSFHIVINVLLQFLHQYVLPPLFVN